MLRKMGKTLFNHRNDKINDIDKTIVPIEFIKPRGDFKLKPCPFCGSNNVYYFKYKHVAGIRYGCICLNCIAQINQGYAQKKSTVMEALNRRI